MENQQTIKKYEDLLRQYNILNQIAKTVASTLDLNRLLRVILTGVTLGDGFGFNRAFLFLIDRKQKNLIGKMAIGPGSEDEARTIWSEIQRRNISLEEILSSQKFETEYIHPTLEEKIKRIIIPINPDKIIFKCLEDGTPRNVNLTAQKSESEEYFITDSSLFEREILDYLNCPKFCLLPLISRTKKVGILIADNKYTGREITKDDLNFLFMLSQFAASSIRNTIIYNDLKDSLSALVRLNKQLKYMKNYNENIIESIPDSIIVIDSSLKITICNDKASRIIGRDKSDIIGRKVDAYNIHFNGINLVNELSSIMIENNVKGFYRVKVSINKTDLADIYNIILVPFKFSMDKSEGVIIIFDDVTKTVELERSLKEAKKFSQLGKLSATVAHEIRNPLVAIGGYAKRLKRKYTSEGKIDTQNLDVIIGEVERLENIVHDILDYVSERKIELKVMSFKKLLNECIDIAKISAEQNNIEIIINSGLELIESKNIKLRGSYNSLKQAFINVFNNAIEASKTNEIVKIDFSIDEDQSARWISTRVNNKSSIKSGSDLYNIFLPFYTTKAGGTGLGLSITKKIIEKHSGKIDVESDIEKGTTSTIKLPILKF